MAPKKLVKTVRIIANLFRETVEVNKNYVENTIFRCFLKYDRLSWTRE